MAREHYRQLVWEHLLEADFRARYFGHLAGLLQSRERMIAIVIGVLSSGAFVTLIAKLQLDFLPQTLSLLSAVFSVVLAAMKFGKAAALSATLHTKWSDIKNQYEILWGDLNAVSEDEVKRRWLELEALHKKEDETATQEFRVNKKLAQECQSDVLRMRHLQAA